MRVLNVRPVCGSNKHAQILRAGGFNPRELYHSKLLAARSPLIPCFSLDVVPVRAFIP